MERLTARLTPQQRAAFDRYSERLISERSRAGLTSLKDPEAIERRHFAESLALLETVESLGALASPVVDIGSGAGFPGLPMKIVCPELDITLVEATGKKAAFLAALVRELALSGVTVVNARAEDLGRDLAHRGRYALAVARAVAPLRTLLELALPLLAAGGRLAAQKGSGAEREVREAAAALETLGGEVEAVRAIAAPGAAVEPMLVLVRKVRPTPERYPRRAGTPSRRPL